MHKSRQFSEHTMEVIDAEVHQILERASKAALALLTKHRDGLQAVTDGLMKSEELDRHQIADLLGPSVHKEKEAELPDRPPVLNTNGDSSEQVSETETPAATETANGDAAKSDSKESDSKESDSKESEVTDSEANNEKTD